MLYVDTVSGVRSTYLTRKSIGMFNCHQPASGTATKLGHDS